MKTWEKAQSLNSHPPYAFKFIQRVFPPTPPVEIPTPVPSTKMLVGVDPLFFPQNTNQLSRDAVADVDVLKFS